MTVEEASHEILHTLGMESYHRLLHLVKNKLQHDLLHVLGDEKYHEMLHVLERNQKDVQNPEHNPYLIYNTSNK